VNHFFKTLYGTRKSAYKRLNYLELSYSLLRCFVLYSRNEVFPSYFAELVYQQNCLNESLISTSGIEISLPDTSTEMSSTLLSKLTELRRCFIITK
jgi:hypothetical protein